MKAKTVSELVEQLGGTVKVAGMLGVTSPQVSNMRAEGRIAPKHYLTFQKVCASKGIDLPNRFFFAKSEAA